MDYSISPEVLAMMLVAVIASVILFGPRDTPR